jgi:hypothetical protein
MRRTALAAALLLTLALAVGAPARGTAATRVVLGTNTTGITDDTGAALQRFAAEAGKAPGIAMFYRDWNEGWSTALIEPRFIDPVLARGATPMITWLPQLASDDPMHQPAYSPAAIAAGAFDPFVRRAAREAAAFSQPLLLRLAHEMNGPWSSWGAWVDGNAPTDYVAMWRHVVSIFRAEGATNVRWVWSPNVYGVGQSLAGGSAMPFEPFYPGDHWVDFVGLDGYNWGTVHSSGWQSFTSVFGSSYDAMTRLTGKPMMICETASAEAGGDKPAWILSIPRALQSRMPRVRALIWFDRDKETDWQITSSSASEAAFRTIARSAALSGTARDLFATPSARAARAQQASIRIKAGRIGVGSALQVEP